MKATRENKITDWTPITVPQVTVTLTLLEAQALSGATSPNPNVAQLLLVIQTAIGQPPVQV